MQHFLPHYPPQLWPPAASATAGEIDLIFAVWCAVLIILVAPAFGFITWCAIYYRAGRTVDRSHREPRNLTIEMTWMVVPFLVSLVFFFWAGSVYLRQQNPPPNAMTITALGRQWMWKFQHPGGQWEINDLHVPVDTPVRIEIESQDVVHSLYIPALRQQEEAVPGRTTQMWFKADRVGAYNLYCSELCGADHALMAGTLYVMSRSDYQAWLREFATSPSLLAGGKRLFSSFGCTGCHGGNGAGTDRAPALVGVYGSAVPLSDGTTITANDAYLRDSILDPRKHTVAGYKPIMPSFSGAISDAELAQLLAYIKSLGQRSEPTQ